LKLEENIKHIFSVEEMLPAVGQGIIAAQCRKNDININKILKKINNEETKQCATAERSLLKKLGGDCDTAVGGLATIQKNELTLSAQLFSDSGDQYYIYKTKGRREDGADIGAIVGMEILKKAGNSFKKK
jgi:hydroxymethylbilane synthase